MKPFLIAIFIGVFLAGHAQEKLPKIGVISVEDFQLNIPDQDTTSSAFVIFEKGNCILEPGSTSGTTLKRHIRIKILKKDGIEKWSEVKLQGLRGGVQKVKGFTHTLVNGIIKTDEVPANSIYKSHEGKYADVVSFALPNVSEGCIIEYSYQVTFIDFYLPSWTFQNSIPTVISEYTISAPITKYTVDVRGPHKIDFHESLYEGKEQRWIMKNLPAFKEEPLMPQHDLYQSSIYFWNLRNTWYSLRDKLLTHTSFGKIIFEHDYLDKKVKSLTAGISDPSQKVDSIVNFVKKTITWDGTNDYYAISPDELLKKKKGSSGDINLLLGSLLWKAGVPVDMVLLSTHDHGLILQDYPTLAQFNYVLCMVQINDRAVLVDGTDKHLPVNLIPPNCLNQVGLRISRSGIQWVALSNTGKIKKSIKADLSISEEGELTGLITANSYEYAAYAIRESYNEASKDDYIKSITPDGWTLDSVSVQMSDDVKSPIRESYRATIHNSVTYNGDLVYVNPFISQDQFNPLTQETRIYPIDFGLLMESNVICSISLPKGYEFEQVPQSKVIAIPNGDAKFILNVSVSESNITITTRILLNKPIFQPEEYPDLREFFTRAIAQQKEPVILKKKTK